MKKAILFLSIICASGLTIVSIYNTVVDAKSWGADIPASIQTARDYYQHVDPRRFYAIAGPVNLILILLTLILFWKDSVSLRLYFAASLVFYVAILILTLAYFVPRNLILFTWSIPDHLEQIRAASAQWSHMNWLRSLLGLAGVLFSFKGLDTYYSSGTDRRANTKRLAT
jgi:Anthrone oxygenase